VTLTVPGATGTRIAVGSRSEVVGALRASIKATGGRVHEGGLSVHWRHPPIKSPGLASRPFSRGEVVTGDSARRVNATFNAVGGLLYVTPRLQYFKRLSGAGPMPGQS